MGDGEEGEEALRHPDAEGMSQKKSVLVTGSAKRIGRRLALDLAKDGWDVAVHCNASIAEAEEVAGFIRNIGQRAVIVRGDLSHDDVPDRLIAEASEGLGGLTCLINNASLFEPDEVGTITQGELGRAPRHQSARARLPVAGLRPAVARGPGRQHHLDHRPARVEAEPEVLLLHDVEIRPVDGHPHARPGACPQHPRQCHRPGAGTSLRPHGPGGVRQTGKADASGPRHVARGDFGAPSNSYCPNRH